MKAAVGRATCIMQLRSSTSSSSQNGTTQLPQNEFGSRKRKITDSFRDTKPKKSQKDKSSGKEQPQRSSQSKEDSHNSGKERLGGADDRTQAPIISPTSHQVVQDKTASDHAFDHTLSSAMLHLTGVDKRFAQLAQRFVCRPFTPEGLREPVDPFKSLCLSILSQQVSGAAARAIARRFVELFSSPDDGGTVTDIDIDPEIEDGPAKISSSASDAAPATDSQSAFFPTPADILSKSMEELRTAGLSLRKAEYIHGLADEFASGRLTTRFFIDASDDEIFDKLVALRGLGPWTVEMFLVFCLKRRDIISPGDLGVQRGMALFFGRNIDRSSTKGKFKYMSDTDMLSLSEPWRPFRSIAMWYMWRIDRSTTFTNE